MQLDIFGSDDETQVQEIAPPLITSGLAVVPEAELMNKTLKEGNLAGAVSILNKLKLDDLKKVLLNAGFAIGHSENRNKLVLSIQKDLINAAKMKMTGYEYLSYKKSQDISRSEYGHTEQGTKIRPTTIDNDPGQRPDRDSIGQSVDVGLAGSSGKPDQEGTIRASIQDPAGTGTGSIGAAGSVQSSFTDRIVPSAGSENRATNSQLDDYQITDEDNLGSGGISKKFNDNLRAIRILKVLDKDSRVATIEERMELVKYSGFGALKSVFDPNNKQWQQAYKDLKEALTPEEYDSARASVLNAHYTSKLIIDSMYNGVERLGFTNGDILESSLGSGNFFGLMPERMRSASNLYGVELDLLTSQLAKAMYPTTNIAVATAFQHYNIPSNFFDLAIGNPPYGSEQIIDRTGSEYSGFSIHNYFLCKQIDKVREGGIVAAVISNSFLDANKSEAREWIAKRANLIAAVRLPNDAFLKNAGTEVVTDIVFFQKTNQPEKHQPWVDTNKIELVNSDTEEVSDVYINNFYIENPKNVLGTNSATGTMYRGNSYTVQPNGDLEKQLNNFIDTLPVDIYQSIVKENALANNNVDADVPAEIKVGCYFFHKGMIKQRGENFGDKPTSFEWVPKNATAIERMKRMIRLREVIRDQIRFERTGSDEYSIGNNRKSLNNLYDEFTSKYGYLNSRTNRSVFLDDTDSPLLQSLEFDYDPGISKIVAENTGVEPREPIAKKADIFNRRVIFPHQTDINVQSAKDALLASLNERGHLDFEYMSDIYAKDQETIIDELGDLVYRNPNTEVYLTADEYLSGDVKTKLKQAESIAQSKIEFFRNIEALKKVIPQDKLPSEIHASLGAGWIPAQVFIEFSKKITGATDIQLQYIKATAQWVSGKSISGDLVLMKSDYGTPDIDSFKLLMLTMANRAPEVKKTILRDGNEVEVIDEEKTDAAKEKQNKIKAEWETWVWSDADRSARLADIYNEKHNRIVNRKFDGSHLKLPGTNPNIELVPSQKNAIWRAIQERNNLLDHVVGAGKTFTMVAIVMELKRLGLARKPMISVPNHLTLQWRSEFTRLYPASNILAATPDDFEKENRQKFFSKIALGDYDAVIVGHSSLKKIELTADIEAKIYKEQLDEIAFAIEDMKNQRGDKGIIRDMEKIKANLDAKFEKLKLKAGKKDKVLTFDELGIDALLNDEHHEFKNLFFYTQMQRVAGLGNPLGSGKAMDLFTKFIWMQEHYGDNAMIVTATGTPISNSLTEMFTMQRYHNYAQMKMDGLHLFDSWAHMYGDVENVYEVSTSGIGYRVSQRFSKFKNMSSLMANYLSFADVVTKSDLIENAKKQGKRFPIPAMVGGKQQNIIAKRSPQQTKYFGIPYIRKNDNGQFMFEIEPSEALIEQDPNGKWYLKTQNASSSFESKDKAIEELVSRSLTPIITIDENTLLGQFANLSQLTRQTKGQINALSLTNLANKAGLDMRIINPYIEDFEDSKINLAVGKMMALYQKWDHVKGTQLVFCDMSVPFSARVKMAQTPRRVYINENNELIHKSGTLHTINGHEDYKFFVVNKKFNGLNGFAIYEPMTGQLIQEPFKTRSGAVDWFESFIKDTDNQVQYTALNKLNPQISLEEISEYRIEKELEVLEDGSNEFTPDELHAISAPAQFSVYEDIKNKLIGYGVPEHEIAFIHDYDTPTKKAALFHNMNIGSIRYTLGSTQKMGAGTNVQRLMVGLHNIDCPWRPSDLEQREGRGLRQGNMLYEADPDNFEIFIGRYATEQTYDTRRWQLIEHKANGIESVRNYNGESEIDGDISEASNSADMKASASGNPLILEETKLRTEVKRLQALRRAHIDSQTLIFRTIKNNTWRAEEEFPLQIKTIEKYLNILSQHPEFKGEDLYKNISIPKKPFHSNDEAYNEIKNILGKARAGFGDQSFTYRGFEIKFVSNDTAESLAAKLNDGNIACYDFKDEISIPGLLTRVRNKFNDLPANLQYCQSQIETLLNENKALLPRSGNKFEYQMLLDQTTEIHNTVKLALMTQAQLEAIPEHEKEIFRKVVSQREQFLFDMGYKDALSKFKRSNHIDLNDLKRKLISLQQKESGVER